MIFSKHISGSPKHFPSAPIDIPGRSANDGKVSPDTDSGCDEGSPNARGGSPGTFFATRGAALQQFSCTTASLFHILANGIRSDDNDGWT